MSAIRSALDELIAVDDAELSVEELAADLVELSHLDRVVEALRSRKIRSLSRRGGHNELGYSSPTAFLCDQTGVAPATAKRVMSYGNAIDKAPAAHRAWVDGRLSTDQARHLFRAAEDLPDVYLDAEERLVDIVEGLDAVDTAKAVTYWRHTMAGPDEIDTEASQQRRGLSLSQTIGGMRRIDGWLTALAGEALQAALDANTPPRREADARTPRQRRHDALENLCRDWLDNGTTPTKGGERPHIVLHADMDALRGVAGGLHETDDGDVIDVETLRLIACDCSITRIILAPGSEVLDVGRKTRVWSPAQRRAITARDRHCQGQGCRARPRHCDIHHLDHWADHGKTAVDRGILLCRPCHTRVHLEDRLRRRVKART